MVDLLDRTSELAALDGAVARALAGAGVLVVVEGPAGIGKTALLSQACARAVSAGMRVQQARGSALEHEIAYGVVRQVLEPVVLEANADARAELFAGAAALAEPVVLSSAALLTPGQPADDLSARAHGLYWLTANLAAAAPLLLAIDDAQWADRASLRFLAYLGRRIEGLPLAVVVAIRTGEAVVDEAALSALREIPSTEVLRPAPLTQGAISALARAHLAAEPDGEFVASCARATGGVPFLVEELLSGLASAGAAPTRLTAATVSRMTSATVAHATAMRLAALGTVATDVAHWVAVLGRHADLRRVSSLSGLDEGTVLDAHDALVEAHILRAGRPMGFSHPIVEASITAEMPAGRRGNAHAAAARLLGREGADAEEVAAHVLLTEPGRTAEFMEPLLNAATRALGRGSPASAVSYLRRALVEAADRDSRARVLSELGSAELLDNDPGGVVHLLEALDRTRDPVQRAVIVTRVGPALAIQARSTEADQLLRTAIDGLEGERIDLIAELEALAAALASWEQRGLEQVDLRRESLLELARRAGAAGRPLAIVLAMLDAVRGRDLTSVAARVDAALDGGRLLAAVGAGAWPIILAGSALWMVEELEASSQLAEDQAEDARRRGSVVGYGEAVALRAIAQARAGSLAAGEADLRAAVEIAQGSARVTRTISALHDCIDVLLQRPQAADLASVVESLALGPDLVDSVHGALLLITRGRLRVDRGEQEQGIDDLRRGGEIHNALGRANPMDTRWRSMLALALPPSHRQEAAALVAEELDQAQLTGFARPIGVALRAAGLIEGGERGAALLRESASALASSPARLEHARSLVALGGALRALKRTVEARGPLAEGLDLATRCGAERLAARAESELRVAGARPRRRALTGVESLTPAEERIAREAAAGLGNREIAQALFLTAKTVENKLGIVYQKLGIRGRGELAALLRAADQSA